MECTHSNDWLKIILRLAERSSGTTLALDIHFQNVDDQTHMMAFSNRSRKAELLCLRVFDEKKQLIETEMLEVIALKDYSIEEHLIVSGGEWVYRLT